LDGYSSRLDKLGLFRRQSGDFTDTKMMQPNKSPEPTAVGAVSSAVAVRAASRRWLSFLR
jgi:hypothetical protein